MKNRTPWAVARAAAFVTAAAVIGATGTATAKTGGPAADAAQSVAEGPGLLGGKQRHEAAFTIHAVAGDGTPLTTGGDRFVVSIAQPEPTPAKVKDNQDGTYTVTYTPERYGNYVIAVTLGGSPVRDAPFTVPVKPAPSAENSYADGPGLAQPVAGVETSFTIHAVDEDGMHRADGGDSFPVAIHGAGGTVPTQTIDNEDGTYTVRYTPPSAGVYTVKVTYSGRHISGSPHQARVAP